MNWLKSNWLVLVILAIQAAQTYMVVDTRLRVKRNELAIHTVRMDLIDLQALLPLMSRE